MCQYVVQQYPCSHAVVIKNQKYLHIFFLPYFHSTFCPIRRFSIRRFVPFGVFTFDILSHSVFFHSTFCPVRRFFHLMFFSIRCFVPFGVVPFDVLSFNVLSIRRLLLRHFVSEPFAPVVLLSLVLWCSLLRLFYCFWL